MGKKTFEKATDDIEKSLKTMLKEYDKLEKRYEKLDAKYEALKASAAVKKSKELQAVIKALEKEKAQLQSEIEGLKNQIEFLNRANIKRKFKEKDREARVRATYQFFEDYSAKLERELAEKTAILEETLVELENVTANNQTNLDAIYRDFSEKMDAKKAEIASLKERVSSLESELAEYMQDDIERAVIREALRVYGADPDLHGYPKAMALLKGEKRARKQDKKAGTPDRTNQQIADSVNAALEKGAIKSKPGSNIPHISSAQVGRYIHGRTYRTRLGQRILAGFAVLMFVAGAITAGIGMHLRNVLGIDKSNRTGEMGELDTSISSAETYNGLTNELLDSIVYDDGDGTYALQGFGQQEEIRLPDGAVVSAQDIAAALQKGQENTDAIEVQNATHREASAQMKASITDAGSQKELAQATEGYDALKASVVETLAKAITNYNEVRAIVELINGEQDETKDVAYVVSGQEITSQDTKNALSQQRGAIETVRFSYDYETGKVFVIVECANGALNAGICEIGAGKQYNANQLLQDIVVSIKNGGLNLTSYLNQEASTGAYYSTYDEVILNEAGQPIGQRTACDAVAFQLDENGNVVAMVQSRSSGVDVDKSTIAKEACGRTNNSLADLLQAESLETEAE